MYTSITELRYWKSEHDEVTCEDASSFDVGQGLFAIADGAGTTLFSNIWAAILIEHFMYVPLMSCHPFEVEWWIRQAQDLFKQRMPSIEGSAWNALQKVQSQGSAATLATLRVTRLHANKLEAEILAIGDSCILIKKANTQEIFSFPVKRESDFEKAPICLPSKPALFNRSFHQFLNVTVELQPNDRVILATDTIARWILSAGGGLYKQSIPAAFDAVASHTPDTWPAFVKACRKRGEMIDDDCTALLLSFHASAVQHGTRLGTTTTHSPAVRTQRRSDFSRAMQEQNKELLAVYYGDGSDLALENVQVPAKQMDQARQVANAMHEIVMALRQALNSPDVIARVGAVWNKHAALLNNETCADNLRLTLTQLGIILPVTPQPENQIAQSVAQAAEDQKIGISQQEKEWQKIGLARKFIGAIHSDDDGEILAAHGAIMESPYTQALNFTPQELERVSLARQRVEHVNSIQAALRSQSVEQMAEAYRQLSDEALPITQDELEQLELAYHFHVALAKDDDAEVVQAYEQILNSACFSSFNFTAHEQELVTLAWGHLIALSNADTSSLDIATAQTLSARWVHDVSVVKHYYLLTRWNIDIQLDQITQLALQDLLNDVYIQKELQEIHHKSRRKIADIEPIVAIESEQFKEALGIPYAVFLDAHQLSDETLKKILRIFLRAEILTKYLESKGTTLKSWLEGRRQEASTRPISDSITQKPFFLEKGKEA